MTQTERKCVVTMFLIFYYTSKHTWVLCCITRPFLSFSVPIKHPYSMELRQVRHLVCLTRDRCTHETIYQTLLIVMKWPKNLFGGLLLSAHGSQQRWVEWHIRLGHTNFWVAIKIHLFRRSFELVRLVLTSNTGAGGGLCVVRRVRTRRGKQEKVNQIY